MRHKTLDEYITGGWTRWVHIHEEIAFDTLQAIQDEVAMKKGETEEKPPA